MGRARGRIYRGDGELRSYRSLYVQLVPRPTPYSFRLEAGSDGGRIRTGRHHRRTCLTAHRHLARSLSPAPHHPSRDCGFRGCTRIAQSVDAEYRSFLCDVFCPRAGRKCHRAIRLYPHRSYLVHNAPRPGARIAAQRQRGWIGSDSPAHSMDDRTPRVAQCFYALGRHRDSGVPLDRSAGTQSPRGRDCCAQIIAPAQA